MRHGIIIAAIGLLALSACDGPKEKAGKQMDKEAAAASGVPYNGDGPNERLGAAEDRADKAAKKELDAKADALKEQGSKIRSDADVEAQKLEEQAKIIRDRAEDKADALNDQAKTLTQ